MQSPRIILTLLALALPVALPAAGPTMEGLPVPGVVPNVEPNIPAGKALLLPFSAYADNGGPVSFTVSSNNPKVYARVRTGHPLLRMRIQHTGDANDPTYEGDIVFQLLRDFAPRAADFIGGFAQGGFYDEYTGHPGVIFHRLADLNDDKNPNTPPLPTSFIYQGGDPTGTGSGGPGFSFDNEFNAAAIFSGRGQLAMANSGYSSNGRGTNGSQFFITDAMPRFLDFNHTIFGQVTHGWEILPKLKATPRGSTDIPTKPVKIIQAEVVAQYKQLVTEDGVTKVLAHNDALLVLSSSAPAGAVITVTATDSIGQTTTHTFPACSAPDTSNSPPFLTPLRNRVAKPGQQVNMPFQMIDLERDFIVMGQSLVENTNGTSSAFLQSKDIKGASGFAASNVFATIGNTSYQASTTSSTRAPYRGPLKGVLSATQFDSGRRSIDGSRSTDDFQTVTVAVGEKALTTEAVQFVALPATDTSSVVARFRDKDGQGQITDFTALINWGDGFASTATGAIDRDTTTPVSGSYRVIGTHNYRRAGVYPVEVTITSPLGLVEVVRSTAYVTAGKITVDGGTLEIDRPTINNREIARFIDTDTPGLAGDYAVSVDWGDGYVTPASVRYVGGGVFSIFGKHTYRDAEDYSLIYRVRKGSGPEVLGYGRVELSGFKGPVHLPPFDQAHLVAEISTVAKDKKNANSAPKPVKETVGENTGPSQTFLNYSITILNSGNKPSKAGQLQLLLSDDLVPNTKEELDIGGNVVRTADKMIEFGPVIMAGSSDRRKSVVIPSLEPGRAITYTFEKSNLGDLRMRLPAGEKGTGLNLLAHLIYSDPIANMQPIERVAAEGRIQGILVSPRAVSTSEIGNSGSFNVKLDQKPLAEVKIPINNGDSTEGALDHTELIFTPDNWFVPQTVMVTGRPDSALPTGTTTNPTSVDGTVQYAVSLRAAVSNDPRYNGLTGPSVIVTNTDIDNNIVVRPSILTATTLTTSEDPASAQHQSMFTIELARRPTDDASVTVEIIVGNRAEGELILPGESVPESGESAFVTFDATNNFAKKTIVVQGKQDGAKDGSKTYAIAFKASSDDPQFDQITPRRLSVTNLDTATYIVARPTDTAATTLTTSENPASTQNKATFTLELVTRPANDVPVTVEITVGNATEGELILPGETTPVAGNKATVTFDAANNFAKKTITVQGKADGVDDGNKTYTLTFDGTSTDPLFNQDLPTPLSVTNLDQD